ncbi:GGDEF domain-containing protein [Kineococcus sp. LSe6-4]|uniref:GGDEF domain-containing protein n=1 Tax=Kineococcus halophytocola TaxID=3234027 RepID=A0ABV4GYD5_9ACTN
MSHLPHRPPPWVAYLLLGGAVALACLLTTGTVHDALLALVSCSSAAAIAVGVRVHRPVQPRAWWAMAAGMACWGAGDVLYVLVYDVGGSQAYPAPPDVTYLLAYPLLGFSLLALARKARPGRDVEGVIDATILSVGAGLLSWVFLLEPALRSMSDDLLGGTVSALYPVADVFVLAMLVRLTSAAGARSPSFALLCAAAVAMLAADAAYQVAYAAVGYDGTAVDPVWLAGYLLWGACALHPSMRRLSDPVPAHSGSELGGGRLVLLAGASLLAPATLALQLLLQQHPSSWAVATSSAVLFLLVVARMWTLLRRLRVQAEQLRALARTDPLTGLLNRRSGDAALQRAAAGCARSGSDLVVVLVDLDHFKAYNDTHGHPAGDRLLVGAAHAWGEVLDGAGAHLARWGGEEFLLVLPGPDRAAVEALLGRMRRVVPDGRTFSAGAARWAGPAQDLPALLAAADAALYAAKAGGRDRTCWAPEAPAAPGAPTPALPSLPALPARGERRPVHPVPRG